MAYANPWLEYERRKYAWIKAHPGATGAEVEAACQRIARELNI